MDEIKEKKTSIIYTEECSEGLQKIVNNKLNKCFRKRMVIFLFMSLQVMVKIICNQF